MFFFFNDTATTEIYTLSLHDALPIFLREGRRRKDSRAQRAGVPLGQVRVGALVDVTRLGEVQREVATHRSEEHTSELQSRQYLVCRLLLEKKKYSSTFTTTTSIPHIF